MIKKILCLVFLFIVCSCIVNAQVTIKLNRENYSPKETLQAEIETIDLARDLTNSNIRLLRNDSSKIDIALSLIKIDKNNYFVYFDIPQIDQGQYSFGVMDVYYSEEGVLTKNSFISNFTIEDRKENILSIKPGYFKGSVNGYNELPFNFVITNKGTNDVLVNLDTENNFLELTQKRIALMSGANKIINVGTILYNKAGNNFKGDINIKYGNLSYVFSSDITRISAKQEETKPIVNNTVVNNVVQNDIINITIGDPFGNQIKEVNVTIKKRDALTSDLAIINIGNNSVGEVLIKIDNELKDIIQLSETNISLDPYQIYPLTIDVNSDKNISKNYIGNIKLFVGSEEVYSMPIRIYLEKEINNTVQVQNTAVNNTVQIIPITESKNNLGIWIGLGAVVLILLVLIIYFYAKGKTKRDEFDTFVENVKNR